MTHRVRRCDSHRSEANLLVERTVPVMTERSPPQPSWPVLAVVGVSSLAWFLYAVMFTGQIFLGLFFPLFGWTSLYLGWRLLVAVEVIADALQRIARQQENE